ncbi:hypothetical protein N825_33880 [Skermanella stibiiresistens SB22]|uniref:N-acetyltransferase domain-containing protein n=1 Tax=Skermanella stibiiresistens SB22 TaxID=1385369 RepID=W9H4D7_9PROT|nr:hypothetical protein [Skermanella stibiiresistens]EWY40924.1 hypothetical protein N825_33880 [Skermanella stibiiresistens SB22]
MTHHPVAQGSAAHPPVTTAIVPASSLGAGQRRTMFRLLSLWFEGYGEDYFKQELDKLTSCVLLNDAETGKLVGFATLDQLETLVGGVEVGVFQTVHCVVDQAYWGTNEIMIAMVGHMFDHALSVRNDIPWYWHYSAVGYRSYRYMPMLFQRHVPQIDRRSGRFETELRDWVGFRYFEKYYQPETGTIDWNWEGYGLTPLAAAIDEAKLNSPAIATFRALNPRWRESVELLCQAELSLDNLTRTSKRWLGRAGVVPVDAAA